MVAAGDALMRGQAAMAVALAAFAAGCAGSGGDKAGGDEETRAQRVAPVGKPVTLTLVSVDELWASEFAAAAKRLSGGTISIEIRFGGSALLDYERRLVEKVRAGEADLASVGARAWDRIGVTSMQAVVAPFLVDSLELQRRVLESPLARRMLAGVESLDLVGLAMLPGPLRRPLGMSRPFVGPSDYAGAAFGARPGRVAQAALRALGATASVYRIGSLGRLDGAELDPLTIDNNGYDAQGSTLTANVVLWPRTETIVIRRAAYERLAPAQRRILHRAGRQAIAPVLARSRRDQDEALETLCARGRLTFATASARELAALRTAVQPVYDTLRRDFTTRALFAEIEALRHGNAAAGESVRCPAERAAASELEGAWRADVSRAELLAAGATAAEAATYAGAGRFELHGGRWTFRGERTTVTGTYAARGELLRLTMQTCTANPCSPGATSEYGWSVYRDRLTLTRRFGRSAWPRLVAAPVTRDR